MGKLFKSWFKKKKSQESIIHPALEIPFQKQLLPPTNTKLYTPDEAPLTFTHGSLLDDVLNGLKDHNEHSKTNQDASHSPLSSSVRHLDSWSKIGTVPEQQNQQKQTIGESYGNNGSSAHQQKKVSQTFLCSPPSTPEAISDACIAPPPPPSTKAMVPPGSAATPSSATPSFSSTSLTPPRLMQSTLHHENRLAISPFPTSDQADDSEASSSGPDTVESNHMAPNRHHHHHHEQQKSNITTTQQQDIQQRRLSSIKPPSIASSHESNQDKRNKRYTQASGISMSRMKERHRQECRRSMQSTGQPQPSPDSYLPQPSTSFQSTPLVNQQQQQPKKSHPKSQQNRHLIASPSMPSIYPVEPMSPPPHPLSQQHHPIPAATNSATSYSFLPPPPSPANSMSMARSSSLMTDIHYQQQSTPSSNIGTMAMSPLANDLMHPSPSWRQQPLFPYQSDIILPPYSPSQLSTFQQQQQQIMQPSYLPKQALLPRSASVYGNVNQYHYKHHSPFDIHQSSGVLLRSPTMDFNGSRKSTPISTRPYQPQLLSLSTQPPSDQNHVSKKQPEDSLDTSASLPASFLPSSSSPSKTPTPSKHQQTSVSSSSSSIGSSVCTTPTNNIDQKVPGTIRDVKGNDTKAMDQSVSRRASTSKSSNNKNVMDEISRTPSPIVSTTAPSSAEDEPSPIKKKQRRRQRRRYSLPTAMPVLSPSRATSVDSEDNNKSSPMGEKDQIEGNGSTIPPLQTENLGKLEIENDSHQHHHQPSGLPPSSACPSTNGMHLCNSGICSSAASPTAASCCPTTPMSPSSPTCQSSHHHLHHQYHHHPHSHYPPPLPPHQHYGDHSYSCTHALPPPPPSSCCQPPSCCSPRPHHHHHHHRHHRNHHHRHHHHHRHASNTNQQMRKSKSCMTKAAMENDNDDDEDDTMTIGSATVSPTPKTSHHHLDAQRQKQQQQRRQRHHLSMPTSQSMINPIHTSADADDDNDDDDDDDDDYTVNGADETTKASETPSMKKSASTQKPFLRSLLPRAPRFTSLPRTLQDQQQQQQQQKTKLTTSKSSYSWMPSRA